MSNSIHTNQNELIADAIMKMLYEYEKRPHITLKHFATFTAQEYYNKAVIEEEENQNRKPRSYWVPF